jgi:ABC-2 type transport system permease protein
MRFLKRVLVICRYRQVLWELAVNQLKTKYAGSVLGISWAVFNPLLMTLAIVFVFTGIFKVDIRNFPLFVLAGMFPWMFFAQAVSEATASLLSQQNLLRQFTVPREILPLASVLSNFLNYLIGWLLMAPLFYLLNPKALPLFFLLLFVFLLNLLFVGGLGLIFSLVHVFFRDFGHVLGILMMFWLWVTPVFYSPEMVPEKFRWVSSVNPMTPIIVFYRDIIYAARVPEPSVFLSVALLAFGTFGAGLWVFYRFESQLLKRF